MGQDGREAFGALGAGRQDGFHFLMKNFAVEKQNGAEGLILSGSRDLALGGQVNQKSLNFGSAHLSRMALAVEENVALDPIQVGFFGTIGIMFQTQRITHLVEKFFSHGLTP